MNQYPQFLRLSHLPRLLMWLILLIVVVLATLGNSTSWAAPVALPSAQTVPAQPKIRMPMIFSPLVNGCDFYNYACNLTVDISSTVQYYDWSPDGSTLAFVSQMASGSTSSLYTINDQGKNLRLLLTVGNISDVRYSPDGTMIALTIYREEASVDLIGGIYIYTLATGELRLLSDPTEGFSDYYPDWSPDSSELVFVRVLQDDNLQDGRDDSLYDLYTIRADGSELTQLTDTPLNENMPAYSPDGSHIVYKVWNQSAVQSLIWVMEADGSNPLNLSSYAAVPFGYQSFWAADSKSVFFVGITVTGMRDIYRVDIDGSVVRKPTNDGLLEYEPLLSPDGSQILFIGLSTTSPPAFYTMNIDGSNVKKHIYPDGVDPNATPGYLQWHPDGKRISYINSGAYVTPHIYTLRVDADAH